MRPHVLIRCHCGELNEQVQLRDEIPVKDLICHCNICRHVTGALTYAGLALVDPPTDIFETKLTKYATSTKIDRYFCSTCGSHILFNDHKGQGKWSVCTGCVDEVIGSSPNQLSTYDRHEFVADTIDGGLAFVVPGMAMYTQAPTSEAVNDMKSEIALLKSQVNSTSHKDEVDVKCQCGQVEFSLLRPKEGDRWKGGLCACRSCRLSIGQPICPWVWNVPYDRIEWKDGTTHNGQVHESVTRFESSDHAHRDFCSNCGASIFYDTSTQHGVLDIAFGVVRAADGALAKAFVKWNTDKIFHLDDALDKQLLAEFKQNLKVLDGA